jgi:hypothetical protein
MGLDWQIGTIVRIVVVKLRAIFSVVTTSGLNGMMPVAQNAAFIFAGVSVLLCASA